MFNGNFHHPLDNLIKDDRLFMMEAILPFVDDRMKAMDMMKTMEAMNTQQSTDSLYRHYQSRTASETEGEENYDNTESQSSQDIYSSVKDLFEKYDMEGY